MNIQFKTKTGSRGIEWTDFTFNVTGGCQHDCRWNMPDGTIAICYAEENAERGVAKKFFPQGFAHHYFHPNRLGAMRRQRKSSLVFIDSMSDLFGHWVPEEEVRSVLDEVRESPQHIGQVLTKNAPRISMFVDKLPANLWVGVSSPPDFMNGKSLNRRQQELMLTAQLKALKQLGDRRPDLVTWMSIEPLSWDISGYLRECCPLKWAVIGAASNGKKTYQPDSRHVENVLAVLDAHNVPVFFKGNLVWNPWREDFPAVDHPALRRRHELAIENGWTPSRFMPAMSDVAE